MERAIEKVVDIRRIDDPEPLPRKLTPQEALVQVEELRRMMIGLFGDPDQPIERIVIRRVLHE